MIRQRLRTGFAALLAAAFCWFLPNPGFGADESPSMRNVKPAIALAEVKPLFVPAHRPEVWPAGDWEILSSKEYHKLLEGLKPQPDVPDEVAIRNARYQAVFTGRNLTGGQLELQIRQAGGQRLLPLDPLNLEMTSLSWSQPNKRKPAAWGNTADGRMLLVLPSSGNAKKPAEALWTLEGEWNATGRTLSERVEFDLKFAPAVVTVLDLFLPEGWTLQASAGQVEGPLSIDEKPTLASATNEASTLKLWRVFLGSETACKLSLSQPKSEKPAKPLLLAESDTTYLIRERELQIESRYELEAAFAPVTQVVFHVPRSIHVYAVSYGGDMNLKWRTVEKGQQKQVIIQFPDPLLGKSRPIRLQGLARIQQGRAWTLPRITCPVASRIRGELHLTVESPLELRSYELAGFRQTAISVQPDQRETLSFSQTAADARLTAVIGTPVFTASAQMVSSLATGTEEWRMRTEVAWVAQSGSRFTVDCEVQPGWEILDVRRAGETSLPVISDWRLTRKGSRLTVEFLDALTPMQSKRVQILARRLPLSAEQTMPLACIKPLNARTVDQFLAVHSHKGDILTTNASQEIIAWKASNFPPFVQNSSLLPLMSAASPAKDVQAFFSRSPESESSLTLRRTAPPYNASLNVLVNFANQPIEETLILTIDPLETPVDRLTLLAPNLEGNWRWELQSGDSPAAAIDAPVSFSEDLMPQDATSVPWELRLPKSQSERFQILARRRVERTPLYQIGLPYLPGARDFQGTVEVTAPGDALLDVQTTFAEEERLPDRAEPSQTEVLRRWHYLSPDATLAVTHLPKNTPSPPLLGRLALSSVIDGYGHTNIHRARYELEASAEHAAFPFSLPENARLIEVRLNEEPLSPARLEEGYLLHSLPPGEKTIVELFYQTTWKAAGISSTCEMPIPQTEVTLLGFEWRFALSPNLNLPGVPSGLALKASAPAPHWTTRFFGPLGHDSPESFFRPWDLNSWEDLGGFQPDNASLNKISDRQDFFPAGWTIHEAQGPRASEPLVLTVWNRDLANRLGWVALLASLTAGFLLRMLKSPSRRPLGLLWLLVTFAGAGLLPQPWAMICGGSFAGTIIAFLFPRRFLRRSRQHEDPIPMGSTASFQHHSIAGALVLVGLGLFAMGQGPVRFLYGQTAPALQSPPNGNKQPDAYNVLVPVEDPADPHSASRIVYIDRPFLEKLRQAQPKPSREDSYLIASADYDLDVDARGSVEILAKLKVLVLTPDRTVEVLLPIENAYLGGPGSCLVDGEPRTVRSLPEGSGYVLELAPKTPAGPAIAEKPDAAKAPPILVREVSLRLHGGATSIPGGGRFQFSVPVVSASRLKATLPEVHESLQLFGTRGRILSAPSGRSLQGSVGASKKIELVWSQKPNGLPKPIKRQPSVYALATIHPFWIEWQIRVQDQPPTGTPFASLSLPENSLVRSVTSDRLDSFRMRPENGATRLFLEFPDPLAAEFSVDVQCITPRGSSRSAEPGGVVLPALDLLAGSPLAESLETECFLGVASTPELTIGFPDLTAKTTSNFLVLPPERFVSGYRLTASETLAIRVPQLAWKVNEPGELRLPIELRSPLKRAWINQEGHLAEREIQWSVTAEIETRGAKAFRHAFQVPEGLLIESVSVFEDETERLVRWTKTGTRLELVLSDGTTGIQNVNITGWLPFMPRAGNRRNLPLVQVENAEIVDSRWRLFQSRSLNHHIQVAGLGDLPVLADDSAFAEVNGARLLAGVRLTDPPPVPAIIVGGEIEESRLEKAVVIERVDSRQVRVTTFLHRQRSEIIQQNLIVRLPVAMTREFRVETLGQPGQIVPYETLTNADQSLDLVFHASFPGDEGTLKIESLIEAEKADRWELFNLQVIQGQVDHAFLVISPELALQSPDAGELPQPLAEGEIPPWFRETKAFTEQGGDSQAYRPTGQTWRLVSAAERRDNEDEVAVRTTVWLTDAKAISGETVLDFPANSLQSLSWHWPEGTRLEGAILDGKELSPVIDEANQTLLLLLPSRMDIKRASSLRTLELYWSRTLDSPLPRFGHLDLAIPKPKEIPIHEARLSLIPSPYARLIPQEGFQPAEGWEQHLAPMSNDNLVAGLLPAESSRWSVSLWTMDFRFENALVVFLLILLMGAVVHGVLRLNAGDWLHKHSGVAWALLGLVWWLGFEASLLGFLLLLIAPLLALGRKTSPESSEIFFAEPHASEG